MAVLARRPRRRTRPRRSRGRRTPEFAALDARDRSLAFDLVNGTLRRRGSIDAVLADVAAVAGERVEPRVLDVLRLGAYQLLFLDRVPAHAAVSDAVALAARRGRRPAGFANAVLQGRSRPDGLRSARATATTAPLAVRYSLPEWIVRRWRSALGAAAEAAFAAATAAPERCLRVNRAASDARAALRRRWPTTASGETVDGLPDALVVTSGPASRDRRGLSSTAS